jgi:hypothetical protein
VGLRDWIDEGNGKCKWKLAGETGYALGIYKWQNGQLTLCFGEEAKGRPRKFSTAGGQVLITVEPKPNE